MQISTQEGNEAMQTSPLNCILIWSDLGSKRTWTEARGSVGGAIGGWAQPESGLYTPEAFQTVSDRAKCICTTNSEPRASALSEGGQYRAVDTTHLRRFRPFQTMGILNVQDTLNVELRMPTRVYTSIFFSQAHPSTSRALSK